VSADWTTVDTKEKIAGLGICEQGLLCRSDCDAGKDCKYRRNWERSASATMGISGESDGWQQVLRSDDVMSENNQRKD
jgi:hypothetical protein